MSKLEFFSQEAFLFPNPIWRVKIENVDNEEIIKYAYEVKEQSDGVQRSNVGGWHSHPYQIFEPMPESFSNLLNDTTQFVNEYCNQITGITNLILGNFWFNINPKNTYNHPHDHAGCLLSAVYYLQADGDGIGNLEVYRGDAGEYFLNTSAQYLKPEERGAREFTGHNFITQPATGYMYIIPSWLKHSVGLNTTDTDRISIALNFGLDQSKSPE